MKNIRSYQTPSLNRYPSRYIYLKHSHLKIGITVMIFLVLVSSILIYVLVREEMKSREVLNLVTETGKRLERIDKSLGNKDLQKAYGDLHETRKMITAFLKPPVEKAEVKERVKEASAEKKAVPVQATVSLPDLSQEIPYPFAYVGDGENLLVCEKETKTLMVFRKTGGKLALVKAYPCLIGANEREKRKDGDLATPIGSYFFVKFIPGKSLAENYGYGAFVLNYPNFLDRQPQHVLRGCQPLRRIGADPQ